MQCTLKHCSEPLSVNLEHYAGMRAWLTQEQLQQSPSHQKDRCVMDGAEGW